MRHFMLIACALTGFGVLLMAADDAPFESAPASDPEPIDTVPASDPFVPAVDLDAIGPELEPAAIPAGQAWKNAAPVPIESSVEEGLQRQLYEAVRARSVGMSPDEIRRLIVLVETEDFEVPAAAQEILDSYHVQANAARAEAGRKIGTYRQTAIEDLKELLVRYIGTGDFEKAVAVRSAIRAMSIPSAKVQDDPGTLSSLRGEKQRVYHFRVTGDVRGSVWGSGTYTTDSDLSTAAVHAGILKPGQTAVVRVTLLPGVNQYPASTRNGVTTSNWGTYGASFRVARSFAVEAETPAESVDEPVKVLKKSRPDDFDDASAEPEPESVLER